MDDDNSKSIDKIEFYKALQDFKCFLSPYNADKLFGLMDIDKNGSISYDEFLRMVTVIIII